MKNNTDAKLRQPIQDPERIASLYDLFTEYMDAYSAEWERIERCERLYRGGHWDDVPKTDANEPRPVTPIVYSTVENIRADLMDMTPEAIITADEPRFSGVAQALNAVIRENHARCGYESEYSRLIRDLLISGTMVQETGFDPSACGGLGGAFIRHVDARGIMFDPYCRDIQDSRAVFKFAPYRREWFLKRYPEHADLMWADSFRLRRAPNGFFLDDSDSILLIECWQREYDPELNRHCVHMCRLAGQRLIADSRLIKPEGYYAHGAYPFTVTALHERKGTFLGYGLADMFESQQRMSDKLDQIVLKNALMASRNKLLVTGASGFDVDDLRDWSKEVHRGDSLSGISWFATAPLPGYLLNYIEEIRRGVKEESGSNDFSRGNSIGGVTAAAAISALQEMSNKRSRMAAKAVHAAFADAVRQELEIEREFSVLPRTVTAGATADEARTVRFSADMMNTRTPLGNDVPIELQVSVKVQRENRFSVIAHNELVLSMVKLNMVTPQAGLDLMIFDAKEQAKALMSPASAPSSSSPASGM